MARPTTGPAMLTAFPNYNVKTNQADWHRESGKGPKGVFLPDWRRKQVRVSPRALVNFADGKIGLIVGGTAIVAGQAQDCHACAGLLSFIPVTMRMAGPAHDIGEEGDWGVPGSVAPVSLAGNGKGLVVVSTGGGQGYSITVLRVWSLSSSGASRSLTAEFIPLSSDTSGVATGCDGSKKLQGRDCWDISGRWQVDPATGTLLIDFSGMRNGQRVAAKAAYGLGRGGYKLISGRNPVPGV
jgi:hypothetical protein